MRIAFFGSSLVSAYWNGAATYYRGLVRALHDRGHTVTFFEPDAFQRQQFRDIEDPDWAEVVIYEASEDGVLAACSAAASADVLVKASGVGVFDDLLEEAVLGAADGSTAAFWDVDAPATLSRLEADDDDPLRRLVPQYDLVFTYGGGGPVVRRYEALGAKSCVPVYNALDADTHHPVPPEPRFEGDLAFLGNRMPDREARVVEFFFRPAELAPERRFLLAGSGWDEDDLPPNVRFIGHLGTVDHNAFNCTPLAILNVLRDEMAANGWSPPTRIFEAAGAGACVISDAWEGIEDFLEPGSEVLVAASAEEVVELLRGLTARRRNEIGNAARQRVLAAHTYARRAELVERVLQGVLVAA
jgi:spore maturation protein CgeB